MAEKVSNTAWSKFPDSAFTDEQYAKSATLDRGTGSGKSRYGLPIREPNGTLNKNAVHAAASRIGSVEGASDEQKKAAAKKIIAAYAAMGETPPDALKKLAADDESKDSESGKKTPGKKTSGKATGKQDMAADTKIQFSEGDFVAVKYRFGSESMEGRIKRVVTDGDVTGINQDFKITGTEDSPAAEVEIHYQGEPSGKVIGFKTSMLRKSFSDDYSEEGSEDPKSEDLDDTENPESVQTPFDFGGVTRLGRKLWRKQVLPFRKIKANKRTFSFDSKKADAVIASHEAGAFDQVPLVLGHTNNPEMGRGEIKGFVKTKTGLDALIETDSRGSEMVENNENLGVSVRYLENYSRESDGKKFGPTIQHVAATYMPRMTGMSGWKPVNLGEDLRGRLALDFSDDDTQVLDLTGSGWESVDTLTATSGAAPDVGIDPIGSDISLTEDDRWMIAQVLAENGLLPGSPDTEEGADGELDDLNVDNANDEEVDELSATEREELARLRADNDEIKYRLKTRDVETYLDECMRAGVPKPDIDAARPILLSAESDAEFEYVELSDDGAETKKATAAKQVRAMLEARKGTVEFGERGADDAKSASEMSDDDKIRERIVKAKEGGVDLSYDAAATELATLGQIRLG